MKQTIVAILLAGLSFNSWGQNFKEQFNDLFDKKDTAGQSKLLCQWKSEQPNDPELFVKYYNYYVSKSRMEMLVLAKHPQGENALQLMEQDTSKKEPAGYLYRETTYDSGILNIGFAYIDTGIAKYPSRLDMRFGKIYMLGEVKDYQNFTKEIIATIDYGDKIRNKCTWENDELAKENSSSELLLSI